MTYQVTGRTYQIKDDLKEMGFSYDPQGKRWIGGEDQIAKLNDKMDKWATAKWGVQRYEIVRTGALAITEVACETCEI